MKTAAYKSIVDELAKREPEDGSDYCQFCKEATLLGDPHKPECLWRRAMDATR